MVPFLSGVLDSQPHEVSGGSAKADFLQGWTFLKDTKFSDRPALHRLIDQLCMLFAVQYVDKPNEAQHAIADTLRAATTKDPAMFTTAYQDT